ncbi:MAG: hypothetical protein SGILL_002111 [Bacillariaceae sp.]
MSSDDAFAADPFEEDMFAEDIHDDEGEDFMNDDDDNNAWNTATNAAAVVVKTNVVSSSNSSYDDDDDDEEETFEDDEMFEEMEELWEEVEDEDEADYDDEMMDEEEEEQQQQQLSSSFRGLVDRPAQMARQNSSLDSLDEEDSNLGLSSVDPASQHGRIDDASSSHAEEEENSKSKSKTATEHATLLDSARVEEEEVTTEHSRRSDEVLSIDQSASVQFDLGSYQEQSWHESDHNVEDLEAACRELLAVVQPNSDPDDTIQRCDLRNLYINLKQQHRHMLHHQHDEHQDDSNNNNDSGQLWESFREEDDEGHDVSMFSGGPLQASEESGVGGDREDDINGFDQDPFEATDAWGSIKGEATGGDDVNFDVANQLPVSSAAGAKAAQKAAEVSDDEDDGNDAPQVEKWLERHADDPEDFLYACRRLIQIIYDDDDEEHTPEYMLRRTEPKDLYRYLKQQYWYKVHTGQLEENALHRVSVLTDDGEEEPEQEGPADINKAEEKSNNGNLDAVLTARRESQRSMQEDAQDSDAAAAAKEEELRKELELIKEEEARVLEEEARLREALEQEAQQQEANDNVSLPSADEPETPEKATTEVPTETASTSVVVLEEESEGEPESSGVNDTESQSSFPDDGKDLPLKREIEDDRSETRKRSKVDGGDSEDEMGSHASDHSVSLVAKDDDENLEDERFENYTKEYNQMLDQQDNGEEVDEVRLYFLELAVRQRLDEELTQSELLELSQFDDEEVINHSRNTTHISRELSVDVDQASESRLEQSEYIDKNDGDDNPPVAEEFVHLDAPVVARDATDDTPNNGSDAGKMKPESDGVEDRPVEEPAQTAASEVSIIAEATNDEPSESMSAAGSDKAESEEQPTAIETAAALSLEAQDTSLNEAASTLDLQNGDKPPEEAPNEENKTATEPDPVELEWRRKKLEEDLNLLVERAEEEELEDLIPTEALVALRLGALHVAMTRKYYDKYEKKDLYFPSVAKAVCEYTLIDAAEEFYKGDDDEFPFEYSNALCTIAASELKTDEVDENDEWVQELVMDVCLGDQNEKASVELEMRRSMIEDELEALILNAEEQELQGKIDPDVVLALKKGAMDAAHIKKVLDTKKDKFVYFPSVAKAVYDFSLIEAAEQHLENGDKEISLEFTNPLCTVAAGFLRGNVDEVDAEDVYVKTTSVYVDLGDGVDRNAPEEDEASICISMGGADSIVEEASQKSGSAAFVGKPFGESFNDTNEAFGSEAFGNEAFGSEAFMNVAFEQDSGGFDPESFLGNNSNDEADEGDKSESHSSVNKVEQESSQSEAKDIAVVTVDASLADLPEQERRSKMIESQVQAIIHNVEEKELDERLDEETINALRSIGASLALVKKYFDVDCDEYVYYPSVAKTIMNYALFDEAERRGVHIPEEHISALRAVAAIDVERHDVNEADDYVFNMSVDVETGIVNYAGEGMDNAEKDSTEVFSDEKAAEEADPEPPVAFEVTEVERLHKLAKSQLDEIVKRAEEQELEEELESEVLEALEAGLKVCFTKKFYDVLKDEYVYFPTVARSIVDYSLTEEAERHYFEEEDEFPTVYTASLRQVAIGLVAEDNLDYDYMGMLALPVEGCDVEAKDTSSVAESHSVGPSRTNAESAPISPAASESSLNANVQRSEANDDAMAPKNMEDSSAEDVDTSTGGVEETGGHAEAEDSAPPPILPVEAPEADAQTKKERSPSPTEEAVQEREVVVTIDDEKALHSVPSELTNVNFDDVEAEDARLQEMEQILEFKRRVDKQKISDDANALEEMKMKGQQKLDEEKKALEEEIRIEESRLNEEASLLHERWLEDQRKLDHDWLELKAAPETLKRIEDEIQSLDTRRTAEEQRIENDTKQIEKERLAEEAEYPQKLRSLQVSIAEAQMTLETERNTVEEEIRDVDSEEKGRGFFGFGSKAKKTDVEKEKQKQTKLMEFKMREMELESEIKDLEDEQAKLTSQSKTRENERVEQLKQLDADTQNLDQMLLDVKKGLEADRDNIQTKLQDAEGHLQSKKAELEATRDDDEAWLATEKEKLKTRRKQVREHLAHATAKQREAEQQEEDRLNRNAVALKEKWVKDEAAFASEIEAFERSKSQLDLAAAEGGHPGPDCDKHVEEMEETSELEREDNREGSQAEAYDGESICMDEHDAGDVTDDRPSSRSLAMDSTSAHHEDGEAVSNHVPDHLVVLNQPKQEDSLRSRDSLHSVEVFEREAVLNSPKKPLLAAALKAKQSIEMNASLSALDDLSAPRSESVHSLHKSVPDHLVMLNQPKSLDASSDSMRPLDIFEEDQSSEKPKKPLLAAALKAKSDQMAKSFSAIEGLSNIAPDTSDFSKSVPSHLFMIHQPKSLEASGELESIGDLDAVFDPPPVEDPEAIPHKPLLTAALKAKKEQMSKSFSLADGILFDSKKETVHEVFSKSVPAHMMSASLDMECEQMEMKRVDAPKTLAAALGAEFESMEAKEASVLKSLDEDVCQVESSTKKSADEPDIPLQEVRKDITPKRKKNQNVGLAKKLMQEAVIFKENSMQEKSVSDHDTKENDSKNVDTYEILPIKKSEDETQPEAPRQDEEAVASKEVSSPDRMAWWKVNGRRLVDINEDPVMEEEKKVLKESLLSHNHAIAVAKREGVLSTPQKEANAASQTPDSLSDKRRKAAESRQRAMDIRSKGAATTESNIESDGQSTKEVSFAEARKSLMNRVETAKEPVIVPPTGNARALEWAHAATDEEPEEESFDRSIESVDDSSRLDWWRKDGKRLVEEVRSAQKAAATSKEALQSVDNDVSDNAVSAAAFSGESSVKKLQAQEEGKSRREILEEKRRQILLARSSPAKAEDREATKSEIDNSFESTGLNESLVEEKKKRLREMEAQRLAERTQKAREYRIMREAQLAETAGGASSGDTPVEMARSVMASDSITRADSTIALTKTSAPSIILQPMVRETDRLSGFIRRYENKLETVCKSLLTVAAEDTDSKEAALAAKDLPLPEMLEFIGEQDWYKEHSAGSPVAQSRPALMFSRSESKRAVMEEMQSERGIDSDDNLYTVTAVGKAFVNMDGPQQADVARFLAHLDNASAGMTKETMEQNWNEIARLSGDAQSKRVCDKLDELVSFCLAAHMMK